MYMVMVAARSFGFYIDVLCTIYIIAIVFTFLTISLGTVGNRKVVHLVAKMAGWITFLVNLVDSFYFCSYRFISW